MKKIATVILYFGIALSFNSQANTPVEYENDAANALKQNMPNDSIVLVPLQEATPEQRFQENEEMRVFGMYMIKHAKKTYESQEKNAAFYEKADKNDLATDRDFMKKNFINYAITPVNALYGTQRNNDESLKSIEKDYSKYFSMMCKTTKGKCESYSIDDILPDDANKMVKFEQITFIVVHQPDQIEFKNKKVSLLFYKAEGMNKEFYGALLTYLPLNDLDSGMGFVFEKNYKGKNTFYMPDSMRKIITANNAVEIISAAKKSAKAAYYQNLSQLTKSEIEWDFRKTE